VPLGVVAPLEMKELHQGREHNRLYRELQCCINPALRPFMADTDSAYTKLYSYIFGILDIEFLFQLNSLVFPYTEKQSQEEGKEVLILLCIILKKTCMVGRHLSVHSRTFYLGK
jgi:hypothetical protein